ncbi:MAG: hypothetical protein PHE84_08215 [bacterium]|nr:hypothetical protein [bacterium]
MDKKMKLFAGLLGGLAILLIGAGCGPAAPDTKAPATPTLSAVTTPTNTATQTISGGKEAGTSILLNGAEIVPLDSSTSWSYSLTLVEGNNNLIIVAQDKAGNLSNAISPTPIIIYSSTVADTTAPTAPTLNAVTSPTRQATQAISGTKEAESSVWINGIQAVPVDSSTTWSHTMALTEGDNNLTLSSKDRAGNESSVTTGLIVRDSTPPAAPTLNTVSSPTKTTPQIISGSKAANSSVYLNGTEIVALDSSTTWTYSLALIAGDNAIYLTSRDALGNESQAVAGLIAYDATAPFTPVVNAVTTPTNLSFQSISGTKEKNSSILIDGNEQVALNGSTTWVCNVILSEGTNTFAVTSKDAAGNTSAAASVTIVRDSTVTADAPAAPVLNAVTTPTNLTTQNISGTKPANTSIRLNGKTIVPLDASTTWLYNNLALIEGNNNLMFTARNAAGVDSEVTTGLIVRDTVKPASPSLNAVVTPTNITPQTISGLKEANTSVRLNSNEIVALNANTTWTYNMALSSGSNAISLTSMDAAGNESGAATGSISYDNVAPANPTVDPQVSPTNVNSQVLTGTKEANSSIVINSVERVTVNSNTVWSCTVSLTTGVNTFTITSKDAAGNTCSGSASASITLDTSAPAAPGLTAVTTPTNSHTQNISGTREANSSVRLNGTEIVAIGAGTNWGPVSLNLVEGNNPLSLTSRDAAGNESTATTGLIVLDTTPPSAPGLAAVTTPTNSATQNISGTREANSSVRLNGTEIVAIGTGAWGPVSIGLVEGNNVLSLTSRDALGNESLTTVGLIVRDMTPPATPVLYPSSITSPTQGIWITLSGTKEANSSIWAKIGNAGIDTERIAINSNTTWNWPVILSLEGDNTFYITSRDALGNISSENKVIITRDRTAPNSPSLTSPALPLSTKATPQAISGTKDANSSVWLNGAEIVPVNSGTTWSYSMSLAEGGNSIFLKSRDALGNESGTVNPGTITLDTTAPNPPVLYASAVTTPTQGVFRQLAGTKDASSSIVINGTEQVPVGGATTWSYTVTLSSEGQNTFNITSKDSLGNESQTVQVVIMRDRTLPVGLTLNAVTNPTRLIYQELSGSKESGTAILINGEVKIAGNSDITWSYIMPLDEGTNNISVTSKDAAGNVCAPQTAIINCDSIAPANPTLNAVVTPTKTSTQTISGTKEGGGSVQSSIWLNDVLVVALNNSISWSYAMPLVEGGNPIYLTSRDAAGNESGPVFGSIVLDTTKPVAPVLTYYETPTRKTPQMLIGIKESGSSVMINGKVQIAYSEATTWVYRMPLTEGPNAITATSWDAVKNESSPAGPYSIILDTAAPTAPHMSTVTTPTNQQVQLVSGFKAANSSIWLNGIEVVPVNSATTWSYGFFLIEGNNTIWTITSRDAAGNEIAGTGVPQSILLDTVPPEAPRLIYPLNHHMNRDGGSFYEWSQAYYPDGGTAYNFQATIMFNHTADFNVPLTDATVYEPWFGWGGLGNGQFAWRVRARDAAGNWGPFSSPRDMWMESASGDASGNNADDIIIGSPNYYDGANYSGRAYFYENGTATMGMPSCYINNPNTVYGGADDWFGKSVAMVGDLDGNYRGEMAIGSPYATQKLNWTYYPGAGSAFIVNYGSSGCSISKQLMSPTGPQNNEYFGSSVAGIGDINGDGYMDLIVGAPGWDGGGSGPNNGRVLIYLGRETLLGTPDLGIIGKEKEGQFGNAVAGIGDFNDDGYDDFIVGSSLYGTAVGRQDGRAYIFFGDSDTGNIGWSNSITLELPSGFKDLGGNKNDRFGEAVAGGGDYNGDGYADAIIGAPFADPNKLNNSGMVMVAYGPDAHTWTILDERFLGITTGTFDWFGYSVGSVTGENLYGNVLVGSPNADWHSPSDALREGYVSLFKGSSSGVDKYGTIVGRGKNDGDLYGNFVSTAGDIDRNGQADYLVGAPYYGAGTGMAEIIYSNGYSSYSLWSPSVTMDNFGWSVGGGGGAGK